MADNDRVSTLRTPAAGSGTRGISRNLADYGDPEFSRFLRLTMLKSAGFGGDALDRPIVGIANTHSDFNPCHSSVPALVEAVKRGVMLAGGLPLEFPTMSLHESMSSPTSMFLRNLMALETEELIRAQPMDAVVLIGGCDKTIPAQLMAAASTNWPAIVLPVGPMLVGHLHGEVLGACTDCRRLWARYRAGELAPAELALAAERLAPTAGTCMVMGTASTIACMTEALGMALPGSATAPATHADRLRIAEATGARAVALAGGGPTPRQIMSAAAFRNALVVLHALGGSTNALLHIIAIAGRCEVEIDLREFDRLGLEVPVLVDVQPVGAHHMEDFHWAGGMRRLLRELVDMLDLSLPTVSAAPLASYLEHVEEVPGQTVIRSRDRALHAGGGIAVLWGNLAPRGAVIKASAASERLALHIGRAVVFDSLEELERQIDHDDLDVTEDDVLVLRNAGPVGAPGMPESGYIRIPRKLARRGVTDMVRISDARMSGTASGTVVLHVTPEAAIGGPLALVQTGDLIRIDVPRRRLDVMIEPDELDRRAAAWAPPRLAPLRGYAALFRHAVLQADAGCDFDFCLPIGNRDAAPGVTDGAATTLLG
jgi:dihydroxy-acid dehydratase